MARRISDKGLALIKRFEGFRAKAYPDAGYGWERATIGYGHTSAAGAPKVVKGMTVTRAEAGRILRKDLRKYERAVERALKVPVEQHQFDAMVSLCFNIGPAGFRRSSVLKHVNAGDDRRAARAFMGWTKSNGKVLKGLVRRRRAEAKMFANTSRTYKAAATGLAGTGASMGAGLGLMGGEVMDIAREVSYDFTWGKYLLLALMIAGIGGIIWGFVRTIWAKADERRAEKIAHDEWMAGEGGAA